MPSALPHSDALPYQAHPTGLREGGASARRARGEGVLADGRQVQA